MCIRDRRMGSLMLLSTRFGCRKMVARFTIRVRWKKMSIPIIPTGPMASCCSPKGSTPVSYTHLDVYKRQEKEKAKAAKKAAKEGAEA